MKVFSAVLMLLTVVVSQVVSEVVDQVQDVTNNTSPPPPPPPPPTTDGHNGAYHIPVHHPQLDPADPNTWGFEDPNDIYRDFRDYKGGHNDRAELKTKLFIKNQYIHDVRPQMDKNHTTVVQMGMALRHIRELNEKQQTLTVNAWIRMTWQDVRLQWNRSEYPDIDDIRVHPQQVWRPDITLYNNFKANDIIHFADTDIVVNNEGRMLWVPPSVLHAFCALDLYAYPFDVHKCSFKMGSWTYHGKQIDLQLYGGGTTVDLYDFDPNSEWQVTHTSAKATEIKYPCCPEMYPDVTFYVTIARNANYYRYTLLIPCVLVMMLSLLVFWVPPDSSEKMTYGMFVLLILVILNIHISWTIPYSGQHVPVILQFNVFTLCMVGLSILLSAIVTAMFHRAPYRKKVVRAVPGWVRAVFLQGLARVMCLRGDRYHSLNENKMEDGDRETDRMDDTQPESEAQQSTFREFVMERQSRFANEESMIGDWQLVAISIDRLFFFIYLLSFAISIIVIATYE